MRINKKPVRAHIIIKHTYKTMQYAMHHAQIDVIHKAVTRNGNGILIQDKMITIKPISLHKKSA